MLFIDSREPESISNIINKEYQIPIKRVRLSLGDYLFSNVCIERKTVNDFLSSIYNRRLFKQLYKLSLFSEKPILIIQGLLPVYRILRVKNKIVKVELTNKELENRKKLVLANLALAYLSYGIPFYWAKSENELIEFIVQLYYKSDKKTPKLIPLKTIRKKSMSKTEIKTAMLGCIPNLGKKLANQLASTLSIQELANMDVSKLIQIKGIGKDTADKIIKILQ